MTRNFHEAATRPITLVATALLVVSATILGASAPAHCHDAAMSARTIEIAGAVDVIGFEQIKAAKRRPAYVDRA